MDKLIQLQERKTSDGISYRRIEISFPYSEGLVSRIKTLPDRMWDKDNRVWWLPAKPYHALAAMAFGKEHMFTIASNVMQYDPRRTINHTVSDRSLLYPYQSEDVDWLHSLDGKAILAHRMGLGKTPITLIYVKEHPEVSRLLVVCPSSVCYKWKDEVSKWLNLPSTVVIGSKVPTPKTDIVIVSYDTLRERKDLRNAQWDMVCLDEAHYISNPKTIRSMTVHGLKAKKIIMLSGTPFYNRPKELWNLLNILDPVQWDNFFAFAHRYCAAKKTHWGWDFNGASNLPELKERLHSVMLRRDLDVLDQLPPLRRQVYHLERNILGYNKLYAGLYDNRQSYVNALPALTKLRQVIGLAKVKAAIELAQSILQDDQSVVLFAHHMQVVKELVDGLAAYETRTIVGSDKAETRAASIHDFQSGKAKVMIISSAGGEGIDLYAASHIIFVEREWNPGREAQIEARLHRIGQQNPVLAHYLVMQDTIDMQIAELIEKKRNVFKQVVDLQDVETNIISELLKELK